MADRDLVALWEAHCRYEFETRDVDATMATMVEQPYVNHIPTMTGGVGPARPAPLLRQPFHWREPARLRPDPISRTVGADRLVDEFVARFTHTTEIDWMLPGIAPTGKPVSVPMVAIVQFQGDKLVHEHIYWDRPRSWCKSACSIRRPAGGRRPMRRARWWTRRCQATR